MVAKGSCGGKGKKMQLLWRKMKCGLWRKLWMVKEDMWLVEGTAGRGSS